MLAYNYAIQAYEGALALDNDTNILQTFYQVVNSTSGTLAYLVDATSGQPVIRTETFMLSGMLEWSDWMAGASLAYNEGSVSLAGLAA